MMDRRLQVLLDAERYERLQTVARERNVSVATVVREAIDRGLATPDSVRRAAADRILAAPEIEVGDVSSLRAEIDSMHDRGV